MDGLTLLHRARAAGLRIEAAGDMLKIRGPRRAEPFVRLLAEHKSEVLAALAPCATDARYWQSRYTARAFTWAGGKRNWQEACRLAWGDLQNEWHSLHGRRWPAWQCAGCERPIGALEAINLPDGNRVHFEPIECLIRLGRSWRRDADAAFAALGLEPPDGPPNSGALCGPRSNDWD
jgi:hypothetical protein